MPHSMQDGVTPPDHVLYGAFLRHAATFEKRARDNDSRGQSGDAFRSPFIRLFGLTADEQATVSGIALDYYEKWSALREQAKSAVNQRHQQSAQSGPQTPGTSVQPLTPELILFSTQMKGLALDARDQVRAALGAARFAQFDAVLRARAEHDFRSLSAMTGGVR